EVDEGFSALKVYPYNLNLYKINALAVDQTNFKLEFTYDLSRSAFYEAIPDNHTLVFEFVNGFKSFTKEVSFEEGTEFLTTGTVQRKTLIFEDQTLFHNNNFQDYTLNVYDQFKGHKKLLATKQLRWYIESD